MARCGRCNKFMLLSPKSGYCRKCEILQGKAEMNSNYDRTRNASEELTRKDFLVGNIISFGTYLQDGEDKDPIEWLILDVTEDGKALLLSKRILKTWWYDDTPMESFGDRATWWEKCSIRRWLNKDFLAEAFCDNQVDAICSVNDKDKITILNTFEVEGYLPNEHDRIASATYEGKFHTEDEDERGERKTDNTNVSWWLQNAGPYCTALFVCKDGTILKSDGVGIRADRYVLGIRPAMWVQISSLITLSTQNEAADIPCCREQKESDNLSEIEKNKRVLVGSFNTKVVGVTYENEGENTENRQLIIADLLQKGLLNQGQELELRPDPANLYDNQAVAVFGPDDRQIGFLPKEVAHRIIVKLSSTGNYVCCVRSVNRGIVKLYGVNVRIDEYEDSHVHINNSDLEKLEKAKKLYDAEHYSDAIDLLEKTAESGLPEAQYLLATCYDLGHGTYVDINIAFDWYLKAAKQGHADAQAKIARNYIDGRGVEEDFQKALYWAQKSAAQNHAFGMSTLGRLYEHGYAVGEDQQKSFRLYKRAAELGDPIGAKFMATSLLLGHGVEMNMAEALKWNIFAAEKGDHVAQFNLAHQYDRGDGTNVDMDKALFWMRKSAENGDEKAQWELQFDRKYIEWQSRERRK